MTDDIALVRIAECDDGAEIPDETEDSSEFAVATYYQRGRERREWVVDRAGPESTDYSFDNRGRIYSVNDRVRITPTDR